MTNNNRNIDHLSCYRPGWQGGPGRPSHGQAGFPAHRLPHHPTGMFN